MKRILFVCTGNTCRSPMAEAMFRKIAKERGLNVDVRSAGVSAVNGQPASMQAIQVLREKGIQDELFSSRIEASLMSWADLVLTMTMAHKSMLLASFPDAVEKTFTLKEYVSIGKEEQSIQEQYEKLVSELQLKQALGQSISETEQRQIMEWEQQLDQLDIVDPFGGSLEIYKACAAEIEAQLFRLADKLAEQ